MQIAQYDTIHAYDEAARASHAVALWLEGKGHRAAAVPAFIPIDMAPPKYGMQGAVDWRGAGVAAGIGGYGESGLLVNFSGGYRAWRNFLIALIEAPPEKRKELTGSQLSLDLRQNFMTGNYYYCFACQAACPVGRPARA